MINPLQINWLLKKWPNNIARERDKVNEITLVIQKVKITLQYIIYYFKKNLLSAICNSMC